MALVGSSVRHFEDPAARGRTAYVVDGDIPQGLLLALNRLAEGAVVLTARQVSFFLNDALKRFYATDMWPVTEEVGVGGSEDLSEDVAGEAAPVVEESSMSPTPSECSDYEAACDSGESSDDDYIPNDESVCGPATTSSLTETGADLLGQYFLVKGEKLLELFQFCPRCGHRLPGGVRLRTVGTAVVNFICMECSAAANKRWESQDRTVPHRSERVYKGNVEAAVSAITTGLRYPVRIGEMGEADEVGDFFEDLFLEGFCLGQAGHRESVSLAESLVLDLVKSAYKQGEGLHLAADGAYDSRGYSALIGKVVLAEERTKPVLHTEVLHRSETEGVSTRMEVEGLRRLMRWVQAQGLQIGSVTTDRSRAALREMEPEIGATPHYYDGWHLAKWLGNELRKVSNLDGCDEIGAWIEKLKKAS